MFAKNALVGTTVKQNEMHRVVVEIPGEGEFEDARLTAEADASMHPTTATTATKKAASKAKSKATNAMTIDVDADNNNDMKHNNNNNNDDDDNDDDTVVTTSASSTRTTRSATTKQLTKQELRSKHRTAKKAPATKKAMPR